MPNPKIEEATPPEIHLDCPLCKRGIMGGNHTGLHRRLDRKAGRPLKPIHVETVRLVRGKGRRG